MTIIDIDIKRNKDRRLANRKCDSRIDKRNKNRNMQGVPLQLCKHHNHFHKLYWNYKKIHAPKYLSLIDNPEAVIKFANDIYEAYHAKHKVFIFLRHVEIVTNDAIVLLLSAVMKFKEKNIAVNGDKPKNKDVAKMIQESGFYDIIQNGFKQYIGSQGYNIDRTNMYTHAQKNVDAELTASIIAKNSKFLWGEERRCQGVQRIFVELMQNTNNHASQKKGEKFWWISASKKEPSKLLCFSFIDYGMGIFNSLKSKSPNEKFYGWIEKIANLCNPMDHGEVLHQMLLGKFHETVTSKYYRGKGIPGIYHQLEKNAICRLIIISNDAYADATENKYYNLANELSGTFVYFEVSQECINLI